MHTSETRARALQKYKQKRIDWLLENGPCKCGSWERLEVDHIDRSTKINHNVWSWNEERRLKELAKCQVLCYDCHKKKSSKEQSEHNSKYCLGENCNGAKLTNIQAKDIRDKYNSGLFTSRQLAILNNVSKTTICEIVRNKRYCPVGVTDNTLLF